MNKPITRFVRWLKRTGTTIYDVIPVSLGTIPIIGIVWNRQPNVAVYNMGIVKK